MPVRGGRGGGHDPAVLDEADRARERSRLEVLGRASLDYQVAGERSGARRATAKARPAGAHSKSARQSQVEEVAVFTMGSHARLTLTGMTWVPEFV